MRSETRSLESIALYSSIIVLLGMLAFQPPLAKAESKNGPRVIRIGADPWCPFNCDPENKTRQGFMIDIARAALALKGYELHYQTVNWARAKHMVQSGDMEAIVGISKSPKSAPLYQFPANPLGRSQVCFYRREGDPWIYRGTPSLEGRRLGWINDYGFGNVPGMDEWIKDHLGTEWLTNVSGADVHARLFSLMERNRIDTFGEDRNVVAYELKQHSKSGSIEVAGCTQTIDPVYIAFSLQHPEHEKLAEALDLGLKELESNGALAALLAEYGLTIVEWRAETEVAE